MHAKRILIVSGSRDGLDAMTGFLRQCGASDVIFVSSGNEARRLVQQDSFALILINTPLPDERGQQLAVQMSSASDSGIILLCKADDTEELNRRLGEYGIFIVGKPIHKSLFHRAVCQSFAVHNRLHTLKQENIRLQNKLEELRYVSRAKCILIETKTLTELEAHRYIEKEAMNRRRTRKEIALEIIEGYEVKQ